MNYSQGNGKHYNHQIKLNVRKLNYKYLIELLQGILCRRDINRLHLNTIYKTRKYFDLNLFRIVKILPLNNCLRE